MELLLLASEDQTLSRAEIERRLADEDVWERGLSVATQDESNPEEQIGVLSLEIPTPIARERAEEALVLAERIASRLGWRVLEPVSGARIEARERERWVSELVAYGEENERERESWLAAAFAQPVWVMMLLAVVAFATAAALVLATNVPPEWFRVAIGVLGAVLLLGFLTVAGAWRSRT